MWRTGWGHSRVLLAARLLAPIGPFDWICWQKIGPIWGVGYGIAGTQGYVPFWGFADFYGTPGFPKGYAVHPD